MASKSSAQAVPGLTVSRVATGLSQPLFVTAPPGDYNRIFIVQKTGQVAILNLSTGVLNATPFLDISARISTVSEQGLLGLAFDPLYSTNGKFYINFVVPGGSFGNGTTHISQFQVSAGNPDIADLSNEKILLTFDHPESNHNGGWTAFSPRPNDDHNLYISTGDGGNANDQGTGHIEPGGNAQNLTTLLGKILRIHVDPTTATVTIPSTNPFASVSGDRGEIFCYGLRNPFRDSFDRANGRLMIADVGQSSREEIDVQDFSNPNGGENYEWRLREGTISTPTISGQAAVGGNRPPGGIDPVLDYPHIPPPSGLSGQTIIGGYIYRGRQIPPLTGTYVFGDYLGPESGTVNPNNFGRIFTLNYNGTSASNPQDITSELFTGSGFTLENPTSFGEDANGELYTTDISAGVVFKIVPVTPSVIINSVTRNAQNGHIVIQGYGVPFKTQHVEFTSNLSQAFGTPGTSVTAAGDGSFSYEDTASGNLSVGFYKVTFP